MTSPGAFPLPTQQAGLCALQLPTCCSTWGTCAPSGKEQLQNVVLFSLQSAELYLLPYPPPRASMVNWSQEWGGFCSGHGEKQWAQQVAVLLMGQRKEEVCCTTGSACRGWECPLLACKPGQFLY